MSTTPSRVAVKRALIGKPRATRRDGGDAPLEDTRPSGLRLGPAVVRRVRDGVRARRARRSLGHGRLPDLADLDRHLPCCWRSSSSPTARPSAPTRRAVAHTSWRRRISARSRASSERPRCSSTTCSRSPYRWRPACSPSPPQLRRLPGTASELSLVFVVLLTVVNLRGVRESGIAFALPTYAFVAAMYALVATGVWKCATDACPQATVPDPVGRRRGDGDCLSRRSRLRERGGRPHRRGGDLERGRRVPAPEGEERRDDARRPRA